MYSMDEKHAFVLHTCACCILDVLQGLVMPSFVVFRVTGHSLAIS